MAKRTDAKKPTSDSPAVSSTPDAPATNTLEHRVVAFAEQLGRIAGTVQAKAEGWMDRDALSQQLASIRDGAAGLLDQLTGDVTALMEEPSAARKKPRSGGVVDAPGKKHRKPPPADKRAKTAATQAAKLRSAKTMVKTNRRRGRG